MGHSDFVPGFGGPLVDVNVVEFFGGVGHCHHGGGIFTTFFDCLNIHGANDLPNFDFVSLGDGQGKGSTVQLHGVNAQVHKKLQARFGFKAHRMEGFCHHYDSAGHRRNYSAAGWCADSKTITHRFLR